MVICLTKQWHRNGKSVINKAFINNRKILKMGKCSYISANMIAIQDDQFENKNCDTHFY